MIIAVLTVLDEKYYQDTTQVHEWDYLNNILLANKVFFCC